MLLLYLKCPDSKALVLPCTDCLFAKNIINDIKKVGGLKWYYLFRNLKSIDLHSLFLRLIEIFINGNTHNL